jgi:hypothetical protein
MAVRMMQAMSMPVQIVAEPLNQQFILLLLILRQAADVVNRYFFFAHNLLITAQSYPVIEGFCYTIHGVYGTIYRSG